MLDAGRFGLEARRFDAAHHLLRHRRGRHVDLTDRNFHQRIAHRAADDAGFLAVAIEQRQQAGDLGILEPNGVVEMGADGHRVVPRTHLPPSTWAGTWVEPGGAPENCASSTKLPITRTSDTMTRPATRGSVQAAGAST